MFGLLDDITDGVENIGRGAINSVSEFVEDPISKTVDVVTQPVRDGLEVVEGLTEGELRVKAAARLGVDVASNMALGELIDWYDQ